VVHVHEYRREAILGRRAANSRMGLQEERDGLRREPSVRLKPAACTAIGQVEVEPHRTISRLLCVVEPQRGAVRKPMPPDEPATLLKREGESSVLVKNRHCDGDSPR